MKNLDTIIGYKDLVELTTTYDACQTKLVSELLEEKNIPNIKICREQESFATFYNQCEISTTFFVPEEMLNSAQAMLIMVFGEFYDLGLCDF